MNDHGPDGRFGVLFGLLCGRNVEPSDRFRLVNKSNSRWTIFHAKSMRCTNKVLHSGSGAPRLNRLELMKTALQGVRDKFTLREVIKFHVNDRAINSFNRRWVANSAFHAIAALGRMAAMNTSETNLTNNDCMFPSRGWSVHITLGCSENFNVLQNLKPHIQ